MSRVTPYGELLPAEEICELKLTLTKSQFVLLDRARDLLAAAGSVPTDAEIFMKAVGDLLTKRDPLRKAERAAALGSNKTTQVDIYPLPCGIRFGLEIRGVVPKCIRMDLAAKRR